MSVPLSLITTAPTIETEASPGLLVAPIACLDFKALEPESPRAGSPREMCRCGHPRHAHLPTLDFLETGTNLSPAALDEPGKEAEVRTIASRVFYWYPSGAQAWDGLQALRATPEVQALIQGSDGSRPTINTWSKDLDRFVASPLEYVRNFLHELERGHRMGDYFTARKGVMLELREVYHWTLRVVPYGNFGEHIRFIQGQEWARRYGQDHSPYCNCKGCTGDIELDDQAATPAGGER